MAMSWSGVFAEDMTSWLYYDATGGAKFGVVAALAEGMGVAEIAEGIAALEASPGSVANFFVDEVSLPLDAVFDDGEVETVPVRFVGYDFDNANVFEYGFVTIGETTHMIMGTSYRQMVDIIGRLSE
jgi:hypothetical protein